MPDLSDARDAAQGAARSAEGAAAELERHPAMRAAARAGHVANGVVHLVIGGIAFGVAFGAGGSADQGGAMRAIASTPFGLATLWFVAIALALLAVFSLVEAGAARRLGGGAGDVLKALGKAVAYGSIAATAFTSISGGSSDGEQQSESLTAQLLAQPFGVVLIVVLGLGVLAISVGFVVSGVTRRFEKHLHAPARARRAATAFGVVGYVAKGVAVGIVGLLFVVAALTHDPEQAGGLDGALRSLRELPFGQILLVVTGLGIAVYGVFCFARAAWATKR